jgi:hypothetical protein
MNPTRNSALSAVKIVAFIAALAFIFSPFSKNWIVALFLRFLVACFAAWVWSSGRRKDSN